MSMPTKQSNSADKSLVRIVRNGQITLPSDVRKALQMKEGDYLEAAVIGGEVRLKPVSVIDRGKTPERLDEIFSRIKYTGPKPVPGADEIAAEVSDIIHDTRRNDAKGGAR